MTDSRKQSCDIPEIHVETTADDYTASIELSNACREFYRNRVQATEHFKQSMSCRNNNVNENKKRTTIDDAMDKLRSEMASLMDQDLSLMKQLLTLNEAIEDLKTKRLYHVSKDSLRASSQELHASDWSVSETDMYETDDDEMEKKTLEITNKMSSLSLPVPLTQDSKFSGNMGLTRRSDITILVRDPIAVKHGQQNSVDSGYGDDNFVNMYQGPLEVSF
ncbi:hypothetical protein ACF0H5_005520 [Mactra antiquata]